MIKRFGLILQRLLFMYLKSKLNVFPGHKIGGNDFPNCPKIFKLPAAIVVIKSRPFTFLHILNRLHVKSSQVPLKI